MKASVNSPASEHLAFAFRGEHYTIDIRHAQETHISGLLSSQDSPGVALYRSLVNAKDVNIDLAIVQIDACRQQHNTIVFLRAPSNFLCATSAPNVSIALQECMSPQCVRTHSQLRLSLVLHATLCLFRRKAVFRLKALREVAGGREPATLCHLWHSQRVRWHVSRSLARARRTSLLF